MRLLSVIIGAVIFAAGYFFLYPNNWGIFLMGAGAGLFGPALFSKKRD